MTFIRTNHELTGNRARKWLHSNMKILLSNPNKLQTTDRLIASTTFLVLQELSTRGSI
jgi:hypothetical protein